MVISVETYKLAYMAVPKAGCSSIKAALATVDPAVEAPAVEGTDVMTWHGLYPTQRFRPKRWEKLEADNWFRFTVVRDPVRRLMSCYANRVVDLKDLHMSRKIRRGHADLPKDPDPDFFFQNLKAYMDASSSIKHHALGSWLFTGTDLTRYSRVYRVEDIDEVAHDLGRVTGRKVTIPKANRSMTTLRLEDLRYRTIAAILPHLDREYAHLKGLYDNPL